MYWSPAAGAVVVAAQRWRVGAPAGDAAARGERARAFAVRGHHVVAPASRRVAHGVEHLACVLVFLVPEAPDRGPGGFAIHDGANKPLPDGDGHEAQLRGDCQLPVPAPAVELAAGHHPADAVPAGSQSTERRAEVHPLGAPLSAMASSGVLGGEFPPAHVDGVGAHGGGPDGAEEVLPAGERREGVRGRVRLLLLVGHPRHGRAVQVEQQRGGRRRQEAADDGRVARLGHGERRQRRRRSWLDPEKKEDDDDDEEEDPAAAMGLRARPHRRAG